jgi:hypothetical protein
MQRLPPSKQHELRERWLGAKGNREMPESKSR